MRRKLTFHFHDGQLCTILNNWNESRLSLTGKQGVALIELISDSGISKLTKGRIDIMCAWSELPAKRNRVKS